MLERLGRHGAVKVVALRVIATYALQEVHLLLRLGALGDDTQIHESSHGHDGLKDAFAALRLILSSEEAHVDFQDVDRDVLQHVERGITAAEIVHEDGEAESFETGDRIGHFLVFCVRAFGDLEL